MSEADGWTTEHGLALAGGCPDCAAMQAWVERLNRDLAATRADLERVAGERDRLREAERARLDDASDEAGGRTVASLCLGCSGREGDWCRPRASRLDDAVMVRCDWRKG